MNLFFVCVFAAEGQDRRLHADARAQLLTCNRTWFSAAEVGTVNSEHLHILASNLWCCKKLATAPGLISVSFCPILPSEHHMLLLDPRLVVKATK